MKIKFPIIYYDPKIGKEVKCHNWKMVPDEYKKILEKNVINLSLWQSVKSSVIVPIVILLWKMDEYLKNIIRKLMSPFKREKLYVNQENYETLQKNSNSLEL